MCSAVLRIFLGGVGVNATAEMWYFYNAKYLRISPPPRYGVELL